MGKRINTFKFISLIKPEVNIFIFLILSLIVGSILSPNFLEVNFLMNSTSLFIEWGIIALPFTLLLIAGEIDLSVASLMTLVACIMGRLFKFGIDMRLVLVIGILMGLVLGLLNGVLVSVTKLPSLIITLGTMSLYKGLAQVLVGDKGIMDFPAWFVGVDRILLFGTIPLPLLIFFVIGIIMTIILMGTSFGRKIFAVGINKHAAEYSGVKVEKIKIFLFTLLGIFCAGAAVISMSRLNLVKYTIGSGGELFVITAVLLGGTAFSGGYGNIISTMLAFFVIVFIRTGMMMATLSGFIQIAIIGGLLIIIMIINNILERFLKEHL
jgi:rhamnose transport system permease protein